VPRRAKLEVLSGLTARRLARGCCGALVCRVPRCLSRGSGGGSVVTCCCSQTPRAPSWPRRPWDVYGVLRLRPARVVRAAEGQVGKGGVDRRVIGGIRSA